MHTRALLNQRDCVSFSGNSYGKKRRRIADNIRIDGNGELRVEYHYKFKHRVVILLERACLHNRIGRNLCKFSRPKYAASQRDVT